MQDLGTLSNADGASYAFGVSADGNVVVGGSATSNGRYFAFRWTQVGGMDNLTAGGALPGDLNSIANAISGDGKVVVGWSGPGSGHPDRRAFRWEGGSMQTVASWLTAAGVTVPSGERLHEATSTNQDGSVVVGFSDDGFDGSGYPHHSWFARVVPDSGGETGGGETGGGETGGGETGGGETGGGETGGGETGGGGTGGGGSGFLPDVEVFHRGYIETGARAIQGAASLPNMTLFGAHHRTLLDSGLGRGAGGVCFWATGDAGRYTSSDSSAGLLEIGACKDIGSLRVGAGLGQVWARQDLALGGKATHNGQYLIAEIGNAFDNGLEASLTGYYGRFDGSMRRRYQNGGAVDTSSGDPDSSAWALRARLDWRDIAKAGSFSLTPHVAYTYARTELDAYTEHGGAFPVAFRAATWNTSDLRLGLTGVTPIGSMTTLHLGVEVAHRFDDSTDGVRGGVLGAGGWNFALPGQRVKQNWGRLVADVDHRLSKTSLLTVGASAATKGPDPSFAVTVRFRMSF